MYRLPSLLSHTDSSLFSPVYMVALVFFFHFYFPILYNDSGEFINIVLILYLSFNIFCIQNFFIQEFLFIIIFFFFLFDASLKLLSLLLSLISSLNAGGLRTTRRHVRCIIMSTKSLVRKENILNVCFLKLLRLFYANAPSLFIVLKVRKALKTVISLNPDC